MDRAASWVYVERGAGALMPDQPNRKRVSKPERAVPVGHGVPGSHEFDALWEPSVDPLVLNDRIRRYKAFADKARRDRAEMRQAMKLKTEEAYNEGLLSVAPKLLEIDKKVAELAHTILNAPIGEDEMKVLKPLLAELTKQRDRLYGKTRARVESTALSASVDINELHRQSQAALGVASSADPESAGETIEAEVVDEEMIDE